MHQHIFSKLFEVLIISTRLGLTSFGGPIAHLGYFHEEYIHKRKWMDEQSYADLVALCQFLPGPASSQIGIGIGVMRAGVLGGIVSFIGFTLPSVIVLIVFASFLHLFTNEGAGWIHGLKIVAVVVVAHAIYGMAKKLTPDLKRKMICLLALVMSLLWHHALSQIVVILVAGLIGFLLFRDQKVTDLPPATSFPVSRKVGYTALALFVSLLLLLPILREITALDWVALFDSFYRSGSLVFGGGHVVLPLLEQELVPTGWLSEQEFLTGYGAAQAVPGPLFTFAAYLGTVMRGWQGGVLATVAIFLPAFLLILGTLPFWNALRRHAKIKGALLGINAAVVGILISAFYHPIWTSSILSSTDFAFASVLFSLLTFWKLPAWIIVILGASGGALLSLFG